MIRIPASQRITAITEAHSSAGSNPLLQKRFYHDRLIQNTLYDFENEQIRHNSDINQELPFFRGVGTNLNI